MLFSSQSYILRYFRKRARIMKNETSTVRTQSVDNSSELISYVGEPLKGSTNKDSFKYRGTLEDNMSSVMPALALHAEESEDDDMNVHHHRDISAG